VWDTVVHLKVHRCIPDRQRPQRGHPLSLAALMALWLPVALCVACVPGPEPSGESAAAIVPHPSLDGLAAFIEESFPDWSVPGLAVAVVVDDRLVFAEGFGVKQIGLPDRIDAATLFQIGSVTKSFGAAAIGALVDDGLASFDDPLVQHLPWFELAELERAAQITLRDLLAHRSGIAEDYYPALEVIDARAVAERARRLENFAPYGDHRYSNLGYGLLSLVVEAATGETWGEWLDDRLLSPLGMDSTHPSPYGVWAPRFVAPTFLGTAPAGAAGIADAPDRNVAMPHGFDRDGERRVLPWQSYDNMQAAGSVASNVLDLADWLRMHLDEGGLDGVTVLQPETLAELFTEQVDAPGYFLFADDPQSSYAMGWGVGSFAGHRYVSHGGGIFGFPAYVALLPEADAGVAVLVNGSMWTPYYPHQEIAAFVFARLLELPERGYHTEAMHATEAIHAQVEQALAAQAAMRNPDAPPSHPLERYAGEYSNAFGETVTVSAADGALRLAFSAPGSFSGDLEPLDGDTFLLHYDGGDGQAFSRSPATFSDSDAGPGLELDLGNLGLYRQTTTN